MNGPAARSGDLILPWIEAKRLKANNPAARWRDIADQFESDVWPQITPGFKIRPGQTVFTIGSCFARNIERQLALLGCRVPMLDFVLPADEWDGQPNSALNKFHPPSFRQSLDWASAILKRGDGVRWSDCEPVAFRVDDDRFLDLDIASIRPVDRARFLERRRQIYEVFVTAFTADCVMMTPGLIEAWRDRTTGMFIHGAPSHKAMIADRGRWELAILSYQTCLDDMLAAIDLVRAHNPDTKVLVTTSPVPMAVTFSGQDIRVANAQSKAVLRAVCGAAAMMRPMVDYFPSYESVTLSPPAGVWKSDRIHVSQGFVGKIVAHMLDHYLEGVEEAARRHQEAVAQIANGDYVGAESAARAALEVRPDHVEARAALAEALRRQGRWAQAEAELGDLVARDPDRLDLKIMLARAIGADPTRLQEALALLETTVARPDVTLFDLLAIFGFIRRYAQREAAAERVLRRAIELYPLNLQVRQPLADLLVAQDRTQEAIEALQQAIAISKPEPDLCRQIAELFAGLGQLGEAMEYARLALQQDPRDKPAALLLTRLEKAGEKARKAARRAAQPPALTLTATDLS